MSAIDALLPPKLTFRPSEVAEILGIGEAAVYEGLRQKTIPSLRIGRRWIVPRPALMRLLGMAPDTLGEATEAPVALRQS